MGVSCEIAVFFGLFSCTEQFLSSFLQLAGLWEEKLKEEQTKTGPLEEVCAALREALDAEHKKRMEAFENKMKPIIIKDGPSKKVRCTLHMRLWVNSDPDNWGLNNKIQIFKSQMSKS